jgi:hypothetical protein
MNGKSCKGFGSSSSFDCRRAMAAKIQKYAGGETPKIPATPQTTQQLLEEAVCNIRQLKTQLSTAHKETMSLQGRLIAVEEKKQQQQAERGNVEMYSRLVGLLTSEHLTNNQKQKIQDKLRVLELRMGLDDGNDDEGEKGIVVV